MNLTIYQIDAFTQQVFGGNPAAVIPLKKWLDDATLQTIANENNLASTAYFIPQRIGYELRCFTPDSEIDICGHATLATAHVLFTRFGIISSTIRFETKAGVLSVEKCTAGYQLDFPTMTYQALTMDKVPDTLLSGLNINASKVIAVHSNSDYFIELSHQADVENLVPIISHWTSLTARRVIVTAIANDPDTDFVSRCFYTVVSKAEDPVTASAHCQLTPYWAAKLGKAKLKAVQLSKRRGYLQCELVEGENGERVRLIGNAVDYMVGQITI